MEIKGRIVLISGANRGIGRALALACLKAEAAEVRAGARNPDSLSDLLNAAGGDADRLTAVQLDVTRKSDVREAAALGRVDILINNAGVQASGGVLKADMQAVREEMEVNYFGVLNMMRAFVPAMVEHGDGMIVNIASALSKVCLPAIGTYCATKAALLSIAQGLRGDLSDKGVRVISVCPGAVDTRLSASFDMPKTSPETAAEEVLRAIRTEAIEMPVGDDARGVFEGLKTDPLAVEKSFAPFRA